MMKTYQVIALLGISLLTNVEAGQATSTNATNRFEVTGMSCDGCAKGIAAELKQTTGVVSAEVSFSNKLAVVVCDTNRVNSARLIKVIEEAGYKAEVKKP